MADLCREIYKENMGHYRYFGTLRARIAWQPAAIALGVASAFATVGGNLVTSLTFFYVVLICIFITDINLKRHQKICAGICKHSQKMIRRIAVGSYSGPINSKGLLKKAKEEATLRPGFASGLLAVFFAVLSTFLLVVLGSGDGGSDNWVKSFFDRSAEAGSAVPGQ